ncbi:MAG TPA: hypothetical protein VF808_00700 [Ktedonobacterales bacterium]
MRDAQSGPPTTPLRLYRLLLTIYPRAFRAHHGDELWQTGRDMAESRAAGGATATFWLALYADILAGALGERWNQMRGSTWTVWLAAGATLLAVLVSVAAGLNIYLLEDGNPLTSAAYSVSSLLRFSYDMVYVAALVAGVTGVAVAAAAFTSAQIARWVTIALAALVALGGFGGLLARRPAVAVAFIVGFAALTALCLLASWGVARALANRASTRTATLIGGCVGAGVALLVDAAALVIHTLALNPVSHALYMQAQIGQTRYNAALIGMVAQASLVILCALLLALAIWSGRTSGHGGAAALGE